MVDLIRKKRDGGVLTDDEIRFIIKGFTDGSIPDYQMSAFAMTVFYKGMTDHETAVLTDAMMLLGRYGGLEPVRRQIRRQALHRRRSAIRRR